MAQISLTSTFSSELLKIDHEHNPHMWLDQENRLLVGTYPNDQFIYDFGKDELVATSQEQMTIAVKPEHYPKKKEISLLHLAERITDVHEIETHEAIYRVGSAKQALLVGLEKVEELAPGTLAELSKQKGRSKRPVSKDRNQLYDQRSQMRYSERLKNGFWVATNNKAHESINYVRKAASLAGLSSAQFQVRK